MPGGAGYIPRPVKRVIYNGVVVPLSRLLLPVVARFRPKVARGIEARRGLLARWTAAARELEGRSPRIWLHAASAGETLQARTIGDAVRASDPDAALIYTFFSPSAEPLARSWDAPDAADYLPFDVADRVGEVLDLLRPDVLVLVGAELWPNLVWEAGAREVRVAQACCRLGPGSGRTGVAGRALARDLYPRFAAIAAVDDSDADALVRLGVAREAIAVAGDTRADATLARIEAAAGEPPPWRPPEGAGPVVVAGSTWPADESVVLDAVARLRPGRLGLVALIAPHEPGEETLLRLEEAADARGLEAVRLGAWEQRVPDGEPPGVVLVDRVGILYRLYAGAAAAYVGGGFGGAVHNTMEPAAQGVPVAIGPRHQAPHEVGALAAADALVEVETGEDLAAIWAVWLDDPSAGRAARETIGRLGGATERTLAHLRARGLPV